MIKWSRFAAAGVVLALFIACASDKVAQSSARGELCERHSDCGSGLACVDGECTIGSFNVPATGNECVLIECEADADCCEESAVCTTYRQECADGIQTSCTQVALLCQCNEECTDHQCRSTCNADTPCPSGTYCEAEQCVECQCDAHCGTGFVCRNGMCASECTRDADCDPFERCQDNECVNVGCEIDRECIALLSNVLAFCDAGECREHCSSDLECGNGEAFTFNACVDGTCRDVGCVTAEECRAFFARTLGIEGINAACEPRAAPPEPGVPGVGGSECPELPCSDTCTYANNGSCNEPTLCAEGTDCTDCLCGNGRMDAGEACDPVGTLFGGSTCQSVLTDPLATGTLYCNADCTIDASYCSGSAVCGNGVAELNEDCDGSDLNFETCSTATLGVYPTGTLYCYSDCTFDTYYCSSVVPGFCGDGLVSATEECDGSNLNGETCSTATSGLYPTGTLYCSGCTFDTFYCSAASYCGDGTVDVNESCDTNSFNGATCSTLTAGYQPYGSLTCGLSCLTIDTSGCYRVCDTCPLYANDGFCDEPGLCTAGTDCSDCCADTCLYALDGFCDEGTNCTYGTDCTDCGG